MVNFCNASYVRGIGRRIMVRHWFRQKCETLSEKIKRKEKKKRLVAWRKW
jgi:hypothetical protein